MKPKPMNAKPPTVPAVDPAADPPRLDEQALARLRELDPDGRHGVLQRVLRTYEGALQRQIVQIAEARDRSDVQAIGNLAHTLKSSSASVGALALSALCSEVERQVRSGETAGLGPRVENLLTEAQVALGAVRAMLLLP